MSKARAIALQRLLSMRRSSCSMLIQYHLSLLNVHSRIMKVLFHSGFLEMNIEFHLDLAETSRVMHIWKELYLYIPQLLGRMIDVLLFAHAI